MKRILSLIFFIFLTSLLLGQVPYTANDVVPTYDGYFRPGVNPGNYNTWTDEQIADLAAGNPYIGVPGIGAKTIRPSLPEVFLDVFGYDVRLGAFQYYDNLGMKENVCFIGYPNLSHRDTTEYCPGQISHLFSNMYEPIWDGGLNGTPYNDDNYLAAYTYKVVTMYKDYVRFWEIWNEPSLDQSNYKALLPPGHPESWWDNDPDPCDLDIQAPVYQYIRMLRVCYDVIKTVDPDAYVSLGGVGYYSFFDVLCRNTDNPVDGSVTPDYPLAGGAYFDAVGIHTYPHFDGSTYFINNNALVFERHSDAAADGVAIAKNGRQQLLGSYGYDGVTYPKKEFIITEINVPRLPFAFPQVPGQNYLGSVEAQRNFVIKALVTAMSNEIHQLHIYNLGDLESEAEAESFFDVMGLYGNLNETPPYTQERTDEGVAYKTASDMLFETAWDPVKSAALNLPSNMRGGALKNAAGEYVYVLWAKTEIDESEAGSATYSFPSSFNISNLYKKEWDYEVTGDEQLVSSQNMTFTTSPVFLTETPAEIDNTNLNVEDCVELIDGFTYIGQHLGHKYFRSNNQLTWEDANAACQSKGGELVEVDDYAENDFLRIAISSPIWIGLNDATTEGQLEWSNGNPLTFNNIDVCNFCNENTPSNDYLILHSWDGKWSYSNSTNAKSFIMEIDCATYVPPTTGGGGTGNTCEDPVPGFTPIGELGGKQYFISNGANEWEDAKTLTEAQGGHLVVINDAAENLFIKNRISEMIHLGLTDSGVEGELEWVDGSPFNYENFQICNFCQGNTPNHDYVIMHQWDGGWSYQTGQQSRRYVMERVCEPDTTNTGGGGTGSGCSDLLSLNKPTDQSSFQSNATAALAVDGNTNGNSWSDNSVALTNWESQPWIEVDLEAVKAISEIEIWNRTDCCGGFLSNYYVFVSDVPFTSTDPTATIAQAGVTNYFETDPAGEPTTIAVNRTGRYVRVQLTGTSFLAVAELKVFGCDTGGGGGCLPAGTPCDDGDATTENDVEDGNCNCAGTPIVVGNNCTTTTNVALGKSTAQSSTLSAGSIVALSSKGVDGNTNGVFFTNPTINSSVAATLSSNQPYWQVDLGDEYLIEEINFYNRSDGTDRTRDCHVMISSVPFDQVDLPTALAQSNFNELITGLVGSPSTLTPNTTGRYIRVQLDGVGYLLVAELEAMGCIPTVIPLAIPNLFNFNVEKKTRTVDLNWTMLDEDNINFYEVEKSADGHAFELLEKQFVTSVSSPSYYQMTDESPFSDESFYRLKLVHHDGTVQYSENKRVNFAIDFRTIQIYPNPTNDFIHITLRELAGKKGTIEIVNSFGQKVKGQTYESIPAIPATFDVSELVSGVYFVYIKIDNHRSVTKKFVVGKL